MNFQYTRSIVLAISISICNLLMASPKHEIIELRFSKITSMKKSYKDKFQDIYLFVGRLKSNLEIGSINIKEGEYIEVMTEKSNCFEYTSMAMKIREQVTYTVSNVVAKRIVKAKKSKVYKWFLHLEANDKKNESLAGCDLSINLQDSK